MILYFRSQALADLWSEELVGQISDGMWENTPRTGWQEYCRAHVTVVTTERSKAALMPYGIKRNFGFSRLIPFVGDRMLEVVRRTEPHATTKTVRAYCQEISNMLKTGTW